jgi:predicted RNA-binding Zn ribbon-like protein
MSIDTLTLVGGNLALDFMNTVGDHLAAQPGEWLKTYNDLVEWGLRAGAVTRDEGDDLLRMGAEQPTAAEAALAKAHETREAVYRLFLSAIRQEQPNADDLRALNHALADAPARTELGYADGKYGWRVSATRSLDVVTWRALWAAADLLASDQLDQVKVCEGDECGWVFLDTSRNRARRWCSMSDCGNRAKANRYYRRHKGSKG